MEEGKKNEHDGRKRANNCITSYFLAKIKYTGYVIAQTVSQENA